MDNRDKAHHDSEKHVSFNLYEESIIHPTKNIQVVRVTIRSSCKTNNIKCLTLACNRNKTFGQNPFVQCQVLFSLQLKQIVWV
jgi:hypothetical protein